MGDCKVRTSASGDNLEAYLTPPEWPGDWAGAEALNVPGDVDMSTGNIKFSGDVVVKGSVNEGFAVECGGSLEVRGKVYNANVTVGGNLSVSEGVNGNHMKEIRVGGFMKCRYIKGCNIKVEGDLFADYIIDSNLECKGNVTLAGSKSALIGGRTTVMGILSANYIGNERGVRTRVALMESPMDDERASGLAAARDRARAAVKSSEESIAKVRELIDKSGNEELGRLYRQLKEQLPAANEELRKIEKNSKP